MQWQFSKGRLFCEKFPAACLLFLHSQTLFEVLFYSEHFTLVFANPRLKYQRNLKVADVFRPALKPGPTGNALK